MPIKCVATATMVAYGLSKLLTRQEHARFVEQLGMDPTCYFLSISIGVIQKNSHRNIPERVCRKKKWSQLLRWHGLSSGTVLHSYTTLVYGPQLD